MEGVGWPATPRTPGTTVTSRALSLLGAFDQRHRMLSLTELAARAGMPMPTAHRLVGELVDWGALTRLADGRYAVGRRIWDVGLLAPVQTGLRQAASPFLHDVYAATLATVHLAVRDRHQVLYVERLSGRASVPIVSTVGSRLPLHCTGVGKVLLAFAPEPVQREVLRSRLRRVTRHTVTAPGLLAEQLRRVRAEGYATTVEEMSLGACSVAVPIRQGPRSSRPWASSCPACGATALGWCQRCRSRPAASNGAWAGRREAGGRVGYAGSSRPTRARPVEPRITSSVGATICAGGSASSGCSSTSDTSRSTAERPAWSVRSLSVVSGGSQKSDPKMLSKPTTLTSSGDPDAAGGQPRQHADGQQVVVAP